MSTRWSTESIVDGLVHHPSCPSFFELKTLNSQEFSQNNEYCVISCFVVLVIYTIFGLSQSNDL